MCFFHSFCEFNTWISPFGIVHQLNSPPKPIKLKETIEAAINVAGTPLNVSGIFESAILERTPENNTNAKVNTSPVPNAFAYCLCKIIAIINVSYSYTENYTVCCRSGRNAQRFIKRRHNLFHYDLNQLNKQCYNKNKSYCLKIFYSCKAPAIYKQDNMQAVAQTITKITAAPHAH